MSILEALKLPSAVESDPRHEQVKAVLSKDRQVLWENGKISIPNVSFTPNLEAVLLKILEKQHLIKGVAQAERALEREKRGLDRGQEKKGITTTANRISRLLIIAQDGTQRLNRACESMLYRYSERLWGIRLDVSSEVLSKKIFQVEQPVKVLLVTDRDAVSEVLFSLV